MKAIFLNKNLDHMRGYYWNNDLASWIAKKDNIRISNAVCVCACVCVRERERERECFVKIFKA